MPTNESGSAATEKAAAKRQRATILYEEDPSVAALNRVADQLERLNGTMGEIARFVEHIRWYGITRRD